MHGRPAQRLVIRLLACGHFDQRGTAQKHLGLVAYQHGVIAQAHVVGSASGGGAEDEGDLRDASGREPRLVGEGTAARHKHLRLIEQIRPGRFDAHDDGQAVFEGDLL